MKIRYKVALTRVICVAVGAVAMQDLHAQSSSDAEKIANAMTAGPAAVSRDASVVEMNEDGSMKLLRQGSGVWTCVPDTPTRSPPAPKAETQRLPDHT